MKSSILLFTIATLAITSSALNAWAQTVEPFSLVASPATEPDSTSPTAVDDRWNFSLSVPMWIAGAKGDLVVRGRKISADQDTADDVDELFDSRLNGAVALHFEAQKNRFGLLLDGMYLDRSVQGTLGATDAEASIKGFIGEIGGIYTLVQPAPDKRGWGMLRLDALGGVRVSALELGLDSPTFDGSVSRTFYDPFVGARVEVGLLDWLSFKLRGDIGGFGIDAWQTSQLTWNVDTRLEFHVARWFDVGVGYRWLDYDLEMGNNSSIDATISGPVVELKFNF